MTIARSTLLGLLLLLGNALVLPAQWGEVRGRIQAEGLSRPSEQRYLYVHLVNPNRIHPDFPQNETEVRAAYTNTFQRLNKLSFVEWASSNKAFLKETHKEPVFPGPAVVFIKDNTLNRNHAVIRKGQFLPVRHLDAEMHSLSARLLPDKTKRLLRRSEAGLIYIDPLFYNWTESCYIHPEEKFIVQEIDHPYFAQVNQDGHFQLKKVPSGNLNFVIVNENGCYNTAGAESSKKGTPINVPPNGVVDLGTIQLQETASGDQRKPRNL